MGLILVVEDDADSRSLIEDVVRLDGHDCISFRDAEEAMRMIPLSPPHLAILDINLPKEHGVSLAWKLRQHWPDLPIIIASAVLSHWEEDDLRDCGADGLLHKPYDLKLLRDTVNRFIRFGRKERLA